MRVALLARVSTESQAAEDRHSLPAQMRAMWARVEREGWSVVRTFEAPGESASTRDLNKRPVLRELVAAARAGEFDLVLFHESSRLARDEELSQWLINELETYGVKLVAGDRPADYFYTPEGRFHFTLESGLDAWQSRKHGAQVRKGLRERWELGLHVGDLPFGYRPVLRQQADGTVVVDRSAPGVVVPEEAPAIREVFALRAAGAGYVELARFLNARGLRPRSKVGNAYFTKTALQSLIETKFYMGVVVLGAESKPGAHEAIITEDEWLRAQAVVKRLRTSRSRRARMLAGLAECSSCGVGLNISQSGRGASLTDYYREGAKGACGSKRWRADEIERRIDELVAGMAADESWLASLERRARQLPAADQGEREKLQAERRRAAKAWIAGELEERDYREVMDAIDARLARLAPAVGRVVFTGRKFRSMADVWAVASAEKKREILRVLWERIYVDLEARRVWFRPHPDFEAVFQSRRRWVRGTPDRTRTSGVPINEKPWLYEDVELLAVAG